MAVVSIGAAAHQLGPTTLHDVRIHNASFDWLILLDHVARYGLSMPPTQGVFCSQKAAIPWAQAMNLLCSQRGPSLDILTKALGVENLRTKIGGTHGAAIDSQQIETKKVYRN